MSANLENSAVATELGKVSFHSNTKERQCQRMFISLIPQASSVILKILQARLQYYVSHEIPNVQTGFRKGRGTKDQIANICWIIEKAKEFQKTSTSDLLIMPKSLCRSKQTVENSSGDGNTRPPYLTPEKSVCKSRSNG